MRGERHVLEGIGRFEAEQATADDDAGFGPGTGRIDRVEVFDGAVDVAVFPVAAVDRRHERVGPGGEDKRVVAELPTGVGLHGPRLAVDVGHALADVNRCRRGWRRQCELVRAEAGEVVA